LAPSYGHIHVGCLTAQNGDCRPGQVAKGNQLDAAKYDAGGYTCPSGAPLPPSGAMCTLAPATVARPRLVPATGLLQLYVQSRSAFRVYCCSCRCAKPGVPIAQSTVYYSCVPIALLSTCTVYYGHCHCHGHGHGRRRAQYMYGAAGWVPATKRDLRAEFAGSKEEDCYNYQKQVGRILSRCYTCMEYLLEIIWSGACPRPTTASPRLATLRHLAAPAAPHSMVDGNSALRPHSASRLLQGGWGGNYGVHWQGVPLDEGGAAILTLLRCRA
jgi:hypothetical protein